MKRPRGLSGLELAKKLQPYGYQVTRQVGSHMRLTTRQNGEHHITIPAHRTLTIGKINDILWALSAHFQIPRKVLAQTLFGR